MHNDNHNCADPPFAERRASAFYSHGQRANDGGQRTLPIIRFFVTELLKRKNCDIILNMNPKNPFVIRGYAGAKYFCDRQKETSKLLSALENDCDVTLIAPRRFGKTGLIRHVFAQLPAEYTGIYLDVYSMRDLSSFTKFFAEAVLGVLDTKVESAMKMAAKFFKSCRPTVTPQTEGLPKFSFDVVASNAEATLKEAFEYLASKDRRVVIAIDEFQQVSKFPEIGTEALLRSYIQFVPHVRFIFAGSHKHMMEQMFAAPNRPFYQSTDFLSLHEIPCEAYREFAGAFFKRAKLPFDAAVFDALYERFEGITWYLQVVLNRVWQMGEGLDRLARIEKAIESIIDDRSDLYHDLLLSQNEGSRLMLLALARERAVKAPTAGTFIAHHGMKAASSASFALNDLRARDLIYETKCGWVIYDRLFGEWLRR